MKMSSILNFKNSKNKKPFSSQRLEYKRLNIYNEYKDYNGYVFKIIGVSKDNLEGEYYNDRNKTCVPVLDGDYLILSKYESNRAISQYKLLIIDFTVEKGFREIITSKKYNAIFNYLSSNDLVSTITPEDKSSYQIKKEWVEYFKELINLYCDKNKNYSCEEIETIFDKNILFEGKIYTKEEFLMQHRNLETLIYNPECELSYHDYIKNVNMLTAFRVSNRLIHKISVLFSMADGSELTSNKLVHLAEICAYNYEYNL